MKKKKYGVGLCLAGATVSALMLQGCTADKNKEDVTEIELVQYKQEAVAIFEELEKKFNETHEDVHLTISSPNDAMTILKTRFIREDYPDIIGIGKSYRKRIPRSQTGPGIFKSKIQRLNPLCLNRFT